MVAASAAAEEYDRQKHLFIALVVLSVMTVNFITHIKVNIKIASVQIEKVRSI
jgi:hypothetical protein